MLLYVSILIFYKKKWAGKISIAIFSKQDNKDSIQDDNKDGLVFFFTKSWVCQFKYQEKKYIYLFSLKIIYLLILLNNYKKNIWSKQAWIGEDKSTNK